MRSAMRCAACVLQTSHDAAPIAATAAMMRSHAASMSAPPSCSRRYGAREPLACLWRERGFSLPRGRIWRTARGPRARYLHGLRPGGRGQVNASCWYRSPRSEFPAPLRRAFVLSRCWAGCDAFHPVLRFRHLAPWPTLRDAPRDALAGLGEAEHPSRPACPPVPSALPQALLPRERMVESRGSADKLMAPIGRLGLTCRSQPDSSTARACSRAGSRGESCSETQT